MTMQAIQVLTENVEYYLKLIFSRQELFALKHTLLLELLKQGNKL